jgi:hypothetical protein
LILIASATVALLCGQKQKRPHGETGRSHGRSQAQQVFRKARRYCAPLGFIFSFVKLASLVSNSRFSQSNEITVRCRSL